VVRKYKVRVRIRVGFWVGLGVVHIQ